MKRICVVPVLVLCVVSFLSLPTYADDEILHDWGVSRIFSDKMPQVGGQMRIDVKHSLTTEKSGSTGWFAQVTFQKATAKATDEGKKLLERLWSIDGVANIQFSSYQILMVKGNAFSWPQLEDKVYSEIDKYENSVSKPKPETPPKTE